jgi:chitin disaccharide deacetylase
MTKYLIVNADDFGASHGINRGIVEAHRHGILTSTSLMVDAPWSEEAALLSRTTPHLSVGLHVDMISAGRQPADGPIGDDGCRANLHRQICRFQELMGCRPTHLDSHHNLHRDSSVRIHFLEMAERYGLPLREYSPVRYFSKFYGQWGGETHLEQISIESLAQILATEIQEGITELGCHPGYADPDFHSSYSAERAIELRTLCDPAIRQALAKQSIQLISFRDFYDLL